MIPDTSEALRLADFRERRLRPRIGLPFAVTVRGVDVKGQPLDIDTVLDNLSVGGL